MVWWQEVRERLRRKNRILIGKGSALLEPLRAELARQNPRVVVLWALDLAEETVCVLEEKFPGETCPRCALEVSRAWAAGAVKMRQAQRAILVYAKHTPRCQTVKIFDAKTAINTAFLTIKRKSASKGAKFYPP